MERRSPLITLGLFLFPLVSLISLRSILPTIDEVLSNDIYYKFLSYIIAILIGLFISSKYRVIKDHEYHRSKAIGRLSKSYKLDEKGAWDNKEDSISDLKILGIKKNSIRMNKKIDTLMSGNIGSLNKEMNEEIIENITTENFENLYIKSSDKETLDNDKKLISSMIITIKSKFNKMINKAALKKFNNDKKNENNLSKKVDNIKINDKWGVKTPSSYSEVVECEVCKSLNYLGNNYCDSCGNYLS